MASFLKGLILLPIAIVVVLLAVANRHPVLVSFDPFSGEAPELSLTVPLFAIVFAGVMLGVVIGGIGAWLGQSGTRRARRHAAREVSRLKAEAERARVHAAAPTPTTGLPALSGAGHR
jgi:uncharacterized membrane protein YciS (DUF1049 family)